MLTHFGFWGECPTSVGLFVSTRFRVVLNFFSIFSAKDVLLNKIAQMKLLHLSDLLDLLERMKTAHPEFSPILNQIAQDASDMAGVTITGEVEWL